jgi:GNAT superfamily N-acetyltransferase
MNAPEAVVRPATAADLPRLWDIRFRNDVAGDPNPLVQGAIPTYLPHLLETGDLRVAERAGDIVAYAAATARSGVIYLNDLFVDPCAQSSKLGQTLLRAVLPESATPRCVLASTDPRAIALYVRFGMVARWPNLELAASSNDVALAADPDLELIEVDAADLDLVARDEESSGRSREVDLRFFQERERGIFLWVRKASRIIGYAAVRFAAARNWHPEAVVVGPVGAREPGDASRCLIAAVGWAAARGPCVEIAVPGPHPGLPGLLDGGLKIVYVETFGASDGGIVDPARYVGSGGDLF